MLHLSWFPARPDCVYPLECPFTRLVARASRPADLSSAQLSSAQFKFSSHSMLLVKKNQYLTISLICCLNLSVSDLLLAPEKLEALISLDTGVWGLSVCLCCIPDIPEPPLPALCFLRPAAPSVQLSPETVTVAAVNGVINNQSLTLTTLSFLHQTLYLVLWADCELWWPKYQHEESLRLFFPFFLWITNACLSGSLAHCSAFPAPLQVPNPAMLSMWIHMCNDLTAASNNWHVEGNLWRWSRAALLAGNVDVSVSDSSVPVLY